MSQLPEDRPEEDNGGPSGLDAITLDTSQDIRGGGGITESWPRFRPHEDPKSGPLVLRQDLTFSVQVGTWDTFLNEFRACSTNNSLSRLAVILASVNRRLTCLERFLEDRFPDVKFNPRRDP